MEFDGLSNRVIGCAIEVHKHLGPGLLESAYQQCLAYELQQHGLGVACQVAVPVRYKGTELDCGYHIDMLVENQLVLELKSVEHLAGIHEAQLLTYLRITGLKIGLLMNFNTTRLKDGVRRFVL